jgi:hypothetical protein
MSDSPPYPVDHDTRLAALQSALEVYAVRYKEQADRIEALEAALRMIDTGISLGPDFAIDQTEHSALIKIQRIARAALAPEPAK